MDDFKEVTKTLTVPKGAGVDGFLYALKTVLRKPRVQEVRIDAAGKVHYRYFARDEEPRDLQLDVDFTDLMPYSIVRNNDVAELPTPDMNAAVALGQLFAAAGDDQMYPIAFVGGANSDFWSWYGRTTGIPARQRDHLHGLPFLTDRFVEDSVLLLCSAFGPTESLSDTRKTYKITIPLTPSEVQVLP